MDALFVDGGCEEVREARKMVHVGDLVGLTLKKHRCHDLGLEWPDFKGAFHYFLLSCLMKCLRCQSHHIASLGLFLMYEGPLA